MWHSSQAYLALSALFRFVCSLKLCHFLLLFWCPICNNCGESDKRTANLEACGRMWLTEKQAADGISKHFPGICKSTQLAPSNVWGLLKWGFLTHSCQLLTSQYSNVCVLVGGHGYGMHLLNWIAMDRGWALNTKNDELHGIFLSCLIHFRQSRLGGCKRRSWDWWRHAIFFVEVWWGGGGWNGNQPLKKCNKKQEMHISLRCK